MVRALGFVRRFSARANDGRSVVVNRFIVGPDSCWFGERLAVASDVCGLRPNKACEIVNRSCFIVQDLEEERSDGLSKSCEVGVGRLSDDWLEVVEGVGEFLYNLLGCHSAPKMARPSSCGSDATIFSGLGKHKDLTVVTTYIEEHHRCFGLSGYFMAAVLAAASYSRIGFGLYLAVCARRVMVPGGSKFHLEPGTITLLSYLNLCVQ